MICNRCGIQENGSAIIKRVQRTGEQLCASCAAKPQSRIGYGEDYCVAWYGKHDDDDNPITSVGKLYLPGVRLCGHKDCVRVSHIQSDTPIKIVRNRKKKPPKPVKWTLEGSLRILQALEDVNARV